MTSAQKVFSMLKKIRFVCFGTLNNGKPFYHQLRKSKKVAICGTDTKQCDARNTIDRIFEKNPKQPHLCSGTKRTTIEVFCMYEGKGGIFDLSTCKHRRERYSFGGEKVRPTGYKMKYNCTLCGLCSVKCPADSIFLTGLPEINKTRSLECGNCHEVCTENTISVAAGM